MNLCTVDGCESAHVARGVCNKHYFRLMRHGDPLAGVGRGQSNKPRPGATNSNWRGGKSKHQLYDTYMDMLGRCRRPTHHAYQRYGGRGITVCDRWQEDFWNFVEDMGPRPEGHSIERVNNDAGYGPDNCKWATRSEQARNKRPPPERERNTKGQFA